MRSSCVRGAIVDFNPGGNKSKKMRIKRAKDVALEVKRGEDLRFHLANDWGTIAKKIIDEK